MKQSDLIVQAETNITAFPKKDIRFVHRPRHLAELQTLVKEHHQNRTPMYVVSTGKNWGLGSKQPVTHENSVVILERMNAIIEVNSNDRYAIIEPGVTQKQLSDYLLTHHPHLKFPVTGSAENTSIVGNMLERGAAFGHRNKLLIGLEVMLASGKLVRTGFWHYFKENNPLAFHYPAGHGPDVRGLFTQSNLGITTKMVIRLPIKKNTVGVVMHFTENNLESTTNTLRDLVEHNILDEGVLITNLNDPRTTRHQNYTYSKQWFACAHFSGDDDFIQLKTKKIKKALSPLSDYLTVLSNDPDATTEHPYHDILKKALQGIPTNYSLQTMAGITHTTLSDDKIDLNPKVVGLISCLPAVAFDGKRVQEVKTLVDQVSKKLDVRAYHNFASIDELTLEGFYRVYFDREDKAAVKQAHLWGQTVHKALKENGFFPYRIDNQSMKIFTNHHDPYWQLIAQLKTALDPHHIISPEKYNVV